MIECLFFFQFSLTHFDRSLIFLTYFARFNYLIVDLTSIMFSFANDSSLPEQSKNAQS